MKCDKELLKGSATTLVLSTLKKKKMYGYELIKEIEEKSEGIFSLKEGTLYPILHSLESAGHVQSEWYGEKGTRRRKYYKITRSGKKLLEEKKKEWGQFSAAMEQIISFIQGDVTCQN